MSTEDISLDSASLRIVRGGALADEAYRLLKAAILDHRLPAGTRLSVPEVARRHGISRSPAREAIARIAADGLAQIEPRRGAIVANLTRVDLIEIYELRGVLEGLACRLAATKITDAELAELCNLVAQHRRAIEADDAEGHKTLDQRFHAAVRRSAGNERLVESLDRLQGQIRIAMDSTRRSPGGMPRALSEHEEILQALTQRDAAGAEAAARAHVARLLRGLRGEE